MLSVFNVKELECLLEDFYRITQIRITVFDEKFQEIISYPDSRPEFCQIIRSCEEGYFACTKCDEEACAYASKERKTHIYRCHAGLTEAITPLFVGKVLVGYLLFGHVFAYDSIESGYARRQHIATTPSPNPGATPHPDITPGTSEGSSKPVNSSVDATSDANRMPAYSQNQKKTSLTIPRTADEMVNPYMLIALMAGSLTVMGCMAYGYRKKKK